MFPELKTSPIIFNQPIVPPKNEIKYSKTGYGEQVWCLRAHSTRDSPPVNS